MIHLFGDEKRRKINLGGASKVASQAELLEAARGRRNERSEQKRKSDAAVRIQSWWRGVREAREVKIRLRGAFERDVAGLDGLRCLVLIGGKDEEALGTWSSQMVQGGEALLFSPALQGSGDSWLVLIRQVSLLLVQSTSRHPQSLYAPSHIQVLNQLLSCESTKRVLGPPGAQACIAITTYLLERNFYTLISQAIRQTPTQSKISPSLISLFTAPLATFPSPSPCISPIFTHIFTIPLLPNRIPLDSLSHFISRIPFSDLYVLEQYSAMIASSTSTEDKVHLVANLHMFIAPHYSKLGGRSLSMYFRFLATILNALPVSVFDPPREHIPKVAHFEYHSDSDEDEPRPRVSLVSSFNKPPPLPKLDSKTLTRLTKVVAPAHIDSLITSTRSNPDARKEMVAFFSALTAVWPSSREQILSTVLALTAGGLVREIYRDSVRRSPLGKEENSSALLEPANAVHWPPLLFLCELYTQALLTMGDDEFFGNNATTRNPLSLDELTSLSRQLLNVAFTLYWRDDQSHTEEGGIPGNPRYTWESVREKVTKCLLAIHARDSRKPFIPPDGWLVTSQIDVNSFIEAAVLEEQQLFTSSGSRPVRTRALSKRQIASMSPRLGVLNNIPFAIPFEARVAIFRNFVMSDMMSREGQHAMFFRGLRGNGRERVQVRRGMVAQDGFDRLGEVDLKAPIEITFIDQFGQEEAGIDGGGVFKEFFTSLCKEVFDTDRGLWLENKKNELYPNPHAYATEAHSLNWYRFIGRILGKAMYEGILVDVAFAGFFLAKWLGKQSFLDDLVSLDPDLYNGLIFLKHYTGNTDDLSLNFTIAVDEIGVTKTIDLIPNGSNIAVTKENRLKYIYLVSHYRLTKQIRRQSDAFFEGLSEMIDPKWLRMFNQQEVQILIGGVNSLIDLDDLRRHTNYGGLYDDKHENIVDFWNVVNTFDQDQRRALLRFVTSCSRPPLLGFKELVPNFSIRDAGADPQRLPTASTCINLLKLPRYSNARILKSKLLQAISSGAGFDLS